MMRRSVGEVVREIVEDQLGLVALPTVGSLVSFFVKATE